MADYFQEMGWRPLADGEQPDHYLHFARLLLDFGVYEDNMTGNWPTLPPPASAKAVKDLQNEVINADNQQCPICLKQHTVGETVKKLPCTHSFHPTCILPWLEKTNSCPLCRFELPTDNEGYEAFKKEKVRAEQKKEDIDMLHNSMFS